MKGSKSSGVLKLTVSASRPLNSTFLITYFTTHAGWTPFFDIHVESTDKPIRITQKSKVHQTTGLDWEKVKLTLSTGMPSNGKVAPLLSAWFLKEHSYFQPSSDDIIIQNSYTYKNQSTCDSTARGKRTRLYCGR
ncbi:MAG: DUF4139 domain-containing protein [Tannerellaceae bacterium]|nr:DUF4139 domain-containing protein [Tannerellaceae bacterium]